MEDHFKTWTTNEKNHAIPDGCFPRGELIDECALNVFNAPFALEDQTLITSQNLSFEQGKEMHEPVPNTHVFFSVSI